VNQRIGSVVAQIHPLVVDSAQVHGSNIDLRSQITKAPFYSVEKLLHLLFARHRKYSPQGLLLVARSSRIPYYTSILPITAKDGKLVPK